MRRLIASEFVTLDGVMEAPGHEPHPDGRNAWALRHAGEDQQRFKVDEVFQAGAILLGRVTYEIFAAFWPTAPKDEGFADRMNDIPKHVVSKTLESPSWRNSTVVRGDPVEAITDLKHEPGGDIFLYGSCDLLNSLIGQNVIDEYRSWSSRSSSEAASACSRKRATRRTWSSSRRGRSSRGSAC